MTVIESDQWQGVGIDEVRPYSPRIRMLQQLKTVAQDQAYLYKHITGKAVPNAPGSTVAANHVHDGTEGAVIPFPYFHTVLGATLYTGVTSNADWQPVCRQLFWNLAGVTTVRVFLFTETPGELRAGGLRVSSQAATSGLPVVDQTDFSYGFQYNTDGRPSVLYADVTVTPDSLQIINVEAFNADFVFGGSLQMSTRDLYAIVGVPWLGDPYPAYSWRNGGNTTGQVETPELLQHLGADPFTSFDDGMFLDDRGVSSYLVQGMTRNEALLWERLTGLPAPLNADGHSNPQHYDGHAHKGDTTSTGTSNVGAEMDHALGSWFYGVGCRFPDVNGLTPTDASSQLNVDEPLGGSRSWSGRIHAPTLKNSTTSAERVAQHCVRMPEGQTMTYADTTGNLKAAALIYCDAAKVNSTGGGSSGVKVTFAMANASGASAATAKTVNTTSGGAQWRVVEVSGLQGESTSGGDIQNLLVDLQTDVYFANEIAIGSVCLWLQR